MSLGSWGKLFNTLSLLICETDNVRVLPGLEDHVVECPHWGGFERETVEAVECTEMTPITPGELGVWAPGGWH